MIFLANLNAAFLSLSLQAFSPIDYVHANVWLGVNLYWKVCSEPSQCTLLSSGSRALVSLSADAKKHRNSVMFRWREKKYLCSTYCILAFSVTFHLSPLLFSLSAGLAWSCAHVSTRLPLLGAIKAYVFDLSMNKIQKCFVRHSVESSLDAALFPSFCYGVHVRQPAGSEGRSWLCLHISHSHQYYSFTIFVT